MLLFYNYPISISETVMLTTYVFEGNAKVFYLKLRTGNLYKFFVL